MVVINGLEAVREALVYHSEDTADRPPVPIYELLGLGPHSEGKQRRVPTEARRGTGPSGGRVTDVRCREESANLKEPPSCGGSLGQRWARKMGVALPREGEPGPPRAGRRCQDGR